MEFLYIHWNPDPALFHLGGFTLRWYSVLWMIAILTGSQVVYHLYKQKGLPLDTFQTLFTYSFIGIFAGARLVLSVSLPGHAWVTACSMTRNTS